MARWNGLCPAGKHGLDHEGQPCDLCPKPGIRVKARPDETDIIDPAGRRGAFLREVACEVTFCLRPDRPGIVGIGWGHIAGVDVHPELLVKTLELLGYTVRAP